MAHAVVMGGAPGGQQVVMAQPVYMAPQAQGLAAQSTSGAVIINRGSVHNDVNGQVLSYSAVQVSVPQNEQQGDATCAWCGCMFSWIPIVGFITYCYNHDAPDGSERQRAS
eukprot:CAMPEP_0182479136 /NCGR_PEP_ID=MMETSP1319-20130603/33674_1 /TAXON_ID=172717 /ORGANISM="Bolidomonas pacifica, Strain RCC208" /LENGTH=110 /DNA_ID=CAMNT_0024680543 /DNA_START=21 /DNA_END=350 /DNA_ORIENTATION=+